MHSLKMTLLCNDYFTMAVLYVNHLLRLASRKNLMQNAYVMFDEINVCVCACACMRESAFVCAGMHSVCVCTCACVLVCVYVCAWAYALVCSVVHVNV